MRHVSSVLRCIALPWHAAPLLLVGIFAVLLQLASHAGMFGIPIALILCSWFFKYAFMLLDHAAQGRPGAPVLTPEAANPFGEFRPLLYLLAIGTFYALSDALGDVLGDGFAIALRVAGLLVLPAIVATHSITGSFAQALNPVAVVEMTRRLGPGYVLVLLVSFACDGLARWVAFDASSVPLVLRIALLMQLWLTLFAALGGVIHERRFEVGFEPEHSPEKRQQRADRERDRERDRFVDQLFAEFRAGARSNPLATIQRRAALSSSPADEYGWILGRVEGWSNPRLANRVAQELLPLLLKAQRNGEALEVTRQRIASDPEFRPATAEQTVRIAGLARDGGDRPTARALLRNFEARFPNDPAQKLVEQLAAQLER